MPLIADTVIDALTASSTFDQVQQVIDQMLTAASVVTRVNLTHATLTQAMGLHLSRSKSPFIMTFSPDTPQAGTTNFLIASGAPIASYRHPPGVPPVDLFGGSIFVPAHGSTVGARLLIQLWHNGAPMTEAVEITATGTRFDFEPFVVTMDEDSLLEVRGDVDNAVSLLSPLRVHVWGRAPLVHGPIQQA